MQTLNGERMPRTSVSRLSAFETSSSDRRQPTQSWVVKSRACESGQATILMTVIMVTVLFGFIGFAIDVQKLFQAKRQAQAAADAAVIAAAEESGQGTTAEQNAANAMSQINGFDPSATSNAATVTLNQKPTGGNYATGTTGSYLEVIVSKPVPLVFAEFATGRSTMAVSGRAVAGAGLTSPSCICLQGTSGTDLTISGGSHVLPTSCGISIDSTSSTAFVMSGGASGIDSPVLGLASTTWTKAANVSGGATITADTHIVQGVAAGCHPPLPPTPAAANYASGVCTADPLGSNPGKTATYSVGPGAPFTTTQAGGIVCYTSLTLGQGSDAVNLNPGIYIIKGGALDFKAGANNASNTGGNGVFFYLMNGATFTIEGQARR